MGHWSPSQAHDRSSTPVFNRLGFCQCVAKRAPLPSSLRPSMGEFFDISHFQEPQEEEEEASQIALGEVIESEVWRTWERMASRCHFPLFQDEDVGEDSELSPNNEDDFVPNDTQEESDLRIARALSLGLRARR